MFFLRKDSDNILRQYSYQDPSEILTRSRGIKNPMPHRKCSRNLRSVTRIWGWTTPMQPWKGWEFHSSAPQGGRFAPGIGRSSWLAARPGRQRRHLVGPPKMAMFFFVLSISLSLSLYLSLSFSPLSMLARSHT